MNKKDKLMESTMLALQANAQVRRDKTKKFENIDKDTINKIKTEPKSENYEKGLKLRDEIVTAWKNNDLKTAWDKWQQLYDLFSTGYDENGNRTDEYSEEQTYKDLYELTSITDTIDNQCVYDVTDYGKHETYRHKGYDY